MVCLREGLLSSYMRGVANSHPSLSLSFCAPVRFGLLYQFTEEVCDMAAPVL